MHCVTSAHSLRMRRTFGASGVITIVSPQEKNDVAGETRQAPPCMPWPQTASPSRAAPSGVTPGAARGTWHTPSTPSTAAAKSSFIDGQDWAYTAGVVAVLLGAALVYFRFPSRDEERQLLAAYHEEDTAGAAVG